MISSGETLLSPSAIKLYGRVIAGLGVDLGKAGTALGANSFLRQQLEENDARFARIYGFSFQGLYTPLSRPTIMLVHGDGVDASPPAAQLKQGSSKTTGVEILANDATLDPATTPVDKSGVAAKEWEFSTDIKVWEYDRDDFSLRLDVSTGPLDRILLQAEQMDGEPSYFRGRRTRLTRPSD
jgi:hypothetical protein